MIYVLPEENWFPSHELADSNGLLAIGGDLSINRLVAAYSQGVFPWFTHNDPILWWSPDPRAVLFPDQIRVSHSLAQKIKSNKYLITIDTDFESVINLCASSRDKKQGTWITPEMIKAYIRLHDAGIAHSFETRLNGTLVGGLYGVSLGHMFSGESMFFNVPDASKISLVFLARLLQALGFHFIDVQQETNHMKSMGAVAITRKKYLHLLAKAIECDGIIKKWTIFGQNQDHN